MNPKLIAGTLLVVLLALASGLPAVAQIQVSGLAGNNKFGFGTTQSQDMTNPGDMFIANDVEIGGEMYLDNVLYMFRDADGPFNEDQSIFFADGSALDQEAFYWDWSDGEFQLTHHLYLNGNLKGHSLTFESYGPTQTFIVDRDGTLDPAVFDHRFSWGNDTWHISGRAMDLVSSGTDVGDLTIAGSLTQNGFDLAEMFLLTESAAAGTVVAVDDSRPDAVRPAVDGDGGRILGIVATDPGIILGGRALSVEALRQQWGDEVAREFERERPALEAAIYAERPALLDEAEPLVSPGAFAPKLAQRIALSRPEVDAVVRSLGTGESILRTPTLRIDEEQLMEAYQRALFEHEARMFDLAMKQFIEQRFARVALAGRVPVRVDAANGPIEIGDPLTASLTPGLAMKATEPGFIIGTALEALPVGSGTIMVFVDRDWFGGVR